VVRDNVTVRVRVGLRLPFSKDLCENRVLINIKN